MPDTAKLQTAGLFDTGTVNFIGHLVYIGSNGLAGLRVETVLEFNDLLLDLVLEKEQLVFSHDITHMFFTS
ncbi:hypothetical protein D3C79_1022220 [compost metagenome]